MRVRLAFRDRDLDAAAVPPPNAEALVEDLGLAIVFRAMARGDKYLHEIATRTLFASLRDVGEIRFRQAALADCIARPAVVRDLYAVTVAALDADRQFWWHSDRYPESLLHGSVARIGSFVGHLRKLRDSAREHRAGFRSDALRRLLQELVDELDEGYLLGVETHLRRLRFEGGIVLSATLGTTNRDTTYVLRRRVDPRGWRDWLGVPEAGSYTWELDPRDMGGAEALGALSGRGIAQAAAAVGESADHIAGYLTQLRAELGYYVGCLNLHDALVAKGEPVCLPDPEPLGTLALSGRGLYDASLSLALGTGRAVGSDVEADGKRLLVVTGANRGGKSTFLRSLGLAQLLMQAGMFVPADAFRADVRDGVFTHFKREEDVTLRSGKLDEELTRMSEVVDLVRRDSLVLLNESFASTNEREGSEIGRQIVRALTEAGVKLGYVTHMYDLASSLEAEWGDRAAFLRAERLPDGERTFRIVQGEPLPTSHGQDIYRRIFGGDHAQETVTDPAGHSVPHGVERPGA
jgi:hypothetical protein